MKTILGLITFSLALTGCFKKDQRLHSLKSNYGKLPDVVAEGTNIAGFSRENYLQSSKKLIEHVQKGDIQFVNEGHRITLVIPTDKYYVFDTAKLNDLKHAALRDIVNLIKCFPNSTIYVAGFTDDVGNYEHKRRLSQQRAQAMVAYLWAHGISERKIEAEGYGDKYAHSNNDLIRGSALNRRIEIQWTI